MCSNNESPRLRSNDGSQGCPILVGNGVCGEPNSLDIMKQFNRLYEDRLNKVDEEDDCLQAKMKIQEEWIHNLSQQNEMLVRAVQDLENEATERVRQLEEKLQKSAQCLCEVSKKYREYDFVGDLLAEPLQNKENCKEDVQNILEFVRRIRDENKCSTEGLNFHHVNEMDLLGTRQYIDKSGVTDSAEEERLLNEKDRTVQDLTQRLNHYNSFGDVEAMSKELCCRREECESLRKDMCDMRHVLTEEVAAKHDEIVLLKKDLQVFEERCMQADKQTAFKEDIIRELRKEIKQLKQQFTQEEVSKLTSTIDDLRDNLERTRLVREQEEKSHINEVLSLNETIDRLEKDLREMEEKHDRNKKTCKICRGRSKVGFVQSAEIQADLENSTIDSDSLQVSSETKSKMKLEIDRKNNEIQMLRNKINELETSLSSCEERAANLQEAVSLYSNSVNVLEVARQEAKLEIEQQKITIANLQEALIEAKQDLDKWQQKSQDNEAKIDSLNDMLDQALRDTEQDFYNATKKAEKIVREYQLLQDLNFSLEVEHCNSLQDIDILESRLNQNKCLVDLKEGQMKKLLVQKKTYEDVVSYFKHEMCLMSEQLNTLQGLLTLTNEASHEENNKVMSAFLEVQAINEKLSSQLCACEQKSQLENQINQIHEAKICELQQLINEKEMDLSQHDQAILNIRKTLNDSLKQNDELQQTIKDLNETVDSLQSSLQKYEYENCMSKKSCQQFQIQLGDYCNQLQDVKNDLDKKTADCLKLEMVYNDEKRALKAAQKQLQETERLQQENQRCLVNSLEEVNRKLVNSEEEKEKLKNESENLKSQLANLTRKEAVKDLEIKRYRKVVDELKTSLSEFNQSLREALNMKKQRKTSCKCVETSEKDTANKLDLSTECSCEVEFYQELVEDLKEAIKQLQADISTTQKKNLKLEAELKEKQTQLSLHERSTQELAQKICECREKDKKIIELEKEITKLTNDIKSTSLQLTDVKRSASEINGSKCVQLACAHDEISNLKSDLAEALSQQFIFKRQSEDLQSQITQLHCTISCLNEKNKLFKDQIDQYLQRIKNLSMEKENLLRKNKEMIFEPRSIQSATCSTDKQQRLSAETLKQFEADLEDLKHNKEEICSESLNVIKNVRAWVAEQKKINSFVVEREKKFIDAIKSSNSTKTMPNPLKSSTPIRPCRINRQPPSGNLCTSPYSLGSQGTGVYFEDETPPMSPDFNLPCTNTEWHAANFRSESEGNDSEEDYCVNTLESLTQQIRDANRTYSGDRQMFQSGCRVTKDTKN